MDNGELQCGVSHVHERPKTPHRRVASGMTSTPGAHPWTASIRLKGVRRTFHHCGAVILSEFYVLTAGHCMQDHPRNVYRVRVGDWDMEVCIKHSILILYKMIMSNFIYDINNFITLFTKFLLNDI